MDDNKKGWILNSDSFNVSDTVEVTQSYFLSIMKVEITTEKVKCEKQLKLTPF